MRGSAKPRGIKDSLSVYKKDSQTVSALLQKQRLFHFCVGPYVESVVVNSIREVRADRNRCLMLSRNE